MTWQWVAVAAIQIAALVFLGRKMFGPTTARVRRKPDVPVGSLVRKKR
jgi:hypothetical protein